MAKDRPSQRNPTRPLVKRKKSRKARTTSPIMGPVEQTVETDDAVEAPPSRDNRSSVPPDFPAGEPDDDTEDARKERRQRRLDAQLLAALYTTTDEEMTRFRRLRLGRDSQAPLDALLRGRELLEVLVLALRAGDDSDAWDDLEVALRTARGGGAAERSPDDRHRSPRAPMVSARPTPAQDAWGHHGHAPSAHGQPLSSVQQPGAPQPSVQQPAVQQPAVQQAPMHHASPGHAAPQHLAAQQPHPHPAQQAHPAPQGHQPQQAHQAHQAHGHADHHVHPEHHAHPDHRNPQGHGQPAWPGQWAPHFPGQAYAPGSLPPHQAGYGPPPGYGQAGPPAQSAGHVPTYPVHQVGVGPPASYADTTTRIPREVQQVLENREPTPPLFKPIGNKTVVAPSSERGGTLPPPPPKTEPPDSDRPPQSTTSPNTPVPDGSPIPPAADITPPASQLDLEALDPESTLHANHTQPVEPLRSFVEDGKTTQLSFTSQAHPFALSLEQYAALCAERDLCSDDAERVRKIHKRYEIGDKRARALVDRLFKLRFSEDPELEASWRESYTRFTNRMRER